MTNTVSEWVRRLKSAAESGSGLEPLPANAYKYGISTALGKQIDLLLEEPKRTRSEVAGALSEEKDDVSLAVLSALATEYSDPDSNVRWSIAEKLAKMPNPGAVDLLARIAREDPDDSVRSRAIESLGERTQVAGPGQGGTKRGGQKPGPSGGIREVDVLRGLRDTEQSAFLRHKLDLTLKLGEE